MEVFDSYLQDTKSLHDNVKLNSSLEKLRDVYTDQLNNTSIPNRKIEDWKYTNLKGILQNNYSFDNQKDGKITKSPNENFHHIYFDNGIFKKDLSDNTDIEITEISNPKLSSEIEPILDSDTYFKTDFSNIFNKSNLSTGYIFRVDPKTIISKPVIIHHTFSGEMSHHNLNNIFIVESSASLHLIEKIENQDNVLINISTDVIVRENGHFHHTVLQDTQYGSLVLNNLNAKVNKDAVYKNAIINTGAKTSRTNLFIDLAGTGACAHAHGLYALHRDQHHDTMSFIQHSAPNTESHQLYKGILDDESRGVFTGRIHIKRDSQLVSANQLNKNLILSKKAHANSRPQLEIYADDVKCAHGSTTGQLSDSELFYFESRGITKEKARQILSRAFAYDVVLKIDNIIIKDFVKEHLLEKHIVS